MTMHSRQVRQDAENAKKVFKVPDHFLPLYAMLVGYPAESWEAGGQRPRPPFESLYFEAMKM